MKSQINKFFACCSSQPEKQRRNSPAQYSEALSCANPKSPVASSGVNQEQFKQLTIENPKRALTGEN